MDVRWTNCGCAVGKMWMMWMLYGCEVGKLWMCGGQKVDVVDVFWR